MEEVQQEVAETQKERKRKRESRKCHRRGRSQRIKLTPGRETLWDLKTNFLLADDGNLQNKNVWKKAMQTYTGYLRDEMEITPKLYYDLFSNLCDSEMQKKLDSIKGIRTMGRKGYGKK